MRKLTELSGNIRAMARSQSGWGDMIHDGSIGGGSNKKLPNALAVLAAAEARFMFWLVKLSGCRPEGDQDEDQTRSPNVP